MASEIIVQHRLQDDSSIYIAELHEIYNALQVVAERQWQKVVICTDSQSVVNSLKMKYPKCPLLIHILNTHQTLSDGGREIVFCWIPGHTGIFGNMQADRYAKDALALDHITNIPIDYNSIKSNIRQAIGKRWQKDWTNVTQATQLRRVKPKIEQWLSANRSSRYQEKVLARLRIGHTSHTHSYIYSRENRPMCARCQSAQTIEHILIHCMRFHNERRAMVDFCNRNNIPFDLQQVLGENETLLQLLFTFLYNIKLSDKL